MTGYIYAIECGGRIKIGYSKHPQTRFNKIASDAPFPCSLLAFWPGDKTDEGGLHARFKELRTYREWFADTISLRAFIADMDMRPKEPATPIVADVEIPDVRQIRRALGLSQVEMASHIGVQQATISRWELGDPVGQMAARAIRRLIEERAA